MPEIGTSGSMSGMGNGALPNGPSYRAHPRLYISEVATPLIEVRSAGHSGLDLRSAGRPARSRECKSLTMKE
jgi:hypothetical protein